MSNVTTPANSNAKPCTSKEIVRQADATFAAIERARNAHTDEAHVVEELRASVEALAAMRLGRKHADAARLQDSAVERGTALLKAFADGSRMLYVRARRVAQ
jgi:hypothetical protein